MRRKPNPRKQLDLFSGLALTPSINEFLQREKEQTEKLLKEISGRDKKRIDDVLETLRFDFDKLDI
jgi:hypothetical protein